MDIRKKEDRNKLWKILVGYFVGFLIIALFLEGIFEINWKISLLIWAIVTIGDILTLRWILRLIAKIVI